MNILRKFILILLVMLVLPLVAAMARDKHNSDHHGRDDRSHHEYNKCPWSPFGDTNSVIELTSTCDAYPDCLANGTYTYSGVNFSKKHLDFQDISTLSTDYNVTATDCGGGSPRFSIIFDSSSGLCGANMYCSIFVYIGPYPNYTGCTPGWQSTGNLIGDPDLRFDTSQIGGTFYDSYANALALAGPAKVIEIDLVVDGGWTDPDPGLGQDILVRNVLVNNYTLNANGEFCKDDRR